MFFHREEELKEIERFLRAGEHAMLVYGTRRIGKTTLINKALEGYSGTVISFQCTSESYESNCQQLTREVEIALNGAWGQFSSFHDIFRFLISLKRPIVVVLDEYNELKDSYGRKETDSMMQKIIDGLKGTDVSVIISGSAVTVMSELLDSSNPLFDRFDSVLHIRGFDYLESAAFIPGWSNRDKASCYSVFGGSPASLENVDPDSSLEENIKRLLLDPRGSCRALVENTLLREYSKIGPALSILGRIGNGRRTYGELRDVFDQRNTGNLSRWLTKMTANDALIRSCPINDRDNPRKAFYSISDNLFGFYFAYVHPNRSRIERIGIDAVYESMVRPSLDTFISYRFEDIAAQYLSRSAMNGRLPGIMDIGSYWYDDRRTHEHGEFDIVLEYADGYDVFEAKFLRAAMPRSLADEEAAKILAIPQFKARRIGFVSMEGFGFSSDEYVLIDGGMLYGD